MNTIDQLERAQQELLMSMHPSEIRLIKSVATIPLQSADMRSLLIETLCELSAQYPKIKLYDPKALSNFVRASVNAR